MVNWYTVPVTFDPRGPQVQYPPQGQYPPPPQQRQYPLPIDSPPQPSMSTVAQGAPTQPQQLQVSDAMSGTFDGGKGSYRIDQRGCNTLLTFQLADMGCMVYGKPGAMVAMSPSIILKNNTKFSMRKLLAGSGMAKSTFAGPGEILIAPPALGDIVPIRLDGKQTWSLGRDGHLAHTQGVKCEMKSMFSREGIKASGQGILFVTGLGAIIQKDLAPHESYIVDNGHLVA